MKAHSMTLIRKIGLGVVLASLASAALAQTPTTTKPNISNTLAQCLLNVPVVGNGAGASPICHASGALGALSFVTPGTGIAASLAANVGSAGAPVLFNGAGGTPSSLSLANATGLPVSGGGTGQATAPAARAASGLNVDSFTGHGDSIYTILATDRTVGTNAAFTASRTWTLPAANAVNPGQEIVVADFQGTVTASNTLIISRAGSDTVNGGTSATISAANGAYLLKSDGTSKWTAQALGAAAAGGVSSVSGAGLATGTVTTSGNITVTAAVQSDQETATSNTVAVTPGTMKFHPGVAKAWARLDGKTGSTCAVTSGSGVASCSRVSAGSYTVTFSTAFSAATAYACNIWPGNVAGALLMPYISSAPTTTQVAFKTANFAGADTDGDYIAIACFGDQ